MKRDVPLFEVKAHLSAIVCERVVGEYGVPDYKDPPEPVGGIEDLFSDELE